MTLIRSKFVFATCRTIIVTAEVVIQQSLLRAVFVVFTTILVMKNVLPHLGIRQIRKS